MNPNPPLENLKPFKPGESGNPAGKPKGTKNFTTLVREALQEVAKLKEGNPEGLTYEQILLKSIGPRAVKDPNVLKMLWEHFDGRPTQKVDMTHELGEATRESVAELTAFFRSIGSKP